MSAVITTNERQLPEPVRAMSPMDIVQLAMDKGFDIDRIEKLMDISERWRKVQAERSFIEALAAFKADPPQVIKDATNKQYASKYATIGNLVNTVNPFLGRHSLSASWDIDQSEPLIKVTCILEHIEGHRRQVTMKAPPDESGAKNDLQKIRSTVTYLQVSTFQAVTGVIADNADDDGNGSGDRKPEMRPGEKVNPRPDVSKVDQFQAQQHYNSIVDILAQDKEENVIAIELMDVHDKLRTDEAMYSLIADKLAKEGIIKKAAFRALISMGLKEQHKDMRL